MTANLNANLGVTLRYTNEEGGTSAITPIAVVCKYKGQNHGAVDVPDQATGTIDIPFGSVDEGATCVIIENKTGQDVEIKWNGQNPESHHHNLATGGVFVMGSPLAPNANPILSVSATLAGTQAGDGSIGYHVFGDPT